MVRKMQILVRHPRDNEEVMKAVKCWGEVGTGGGFSWPIREEDYQRIFIAVNAENQLLGAVEFQKDQVLRIDGYLLRSHEICNIAVYPQCQRQEIGRALVSAVEEMSKKEGKLGLHTAYSGVEEFWKQLGYQKIPPAFWYKIF